MAFFITDKCTSCDKCREECPTQSIFPSSVHHLIDADTCRDCKYCVAVCPVSAIEPLARTLRSNSTVNTGVETADDKKTKRPGKK